MGEHLVTGIFGMGNLYPEVSTSDRIMIFQKNRTEKKIVILDRFVMLESLLLQEPLLLLTYISAVAGIPFAFGVSVVSADAVDLVLSVLAFQAVHAVSYN